MPASGESTHSTSGEQPRKSENATLHSTPGLRHRLAQSFGYLKRPGTISVLVAVLGLNLLVRFEWVNQIVPQFQWAELKFHRVLSSFAPRLITAKWVRTVEIDDKTHAELGEPTNRDFLATLVLNAANGDAAAIVLDVKLLAPLGMVSGQDDEKRKTENAKLLAAIHESAKNGVPVVLTCWLQKRKGGFERRPNIYLDSLLFLPDSNGQCPKLAENNGNDSEVGERKHRMPACVYIGNINLPLDMRRVPLVTRTNDSDPCSNSLALAAASAYEDVMDRKPRTREKQTVISALREDDFPLASFIRESEFQKISIEELYNGTSEAIKHCRGRIIIIGGKWHANLGHGEPVDSYETPVGQMAGMYLQANYIEALLDDRYGREVPLWVALLFDLVVGAWLYVRFHRARTWLSQLGVLVIPGVLLLASYVVFTNLNLYLDFVLPLGVCFVHLGVEYVRDYWRLLKASSRTDRSQVDAG